MGTVDMTPSPAAYQQMLKVIQENNPAPEMREWATSELERIQPAIEAGTWNLTAAEYRQWVALEQEGN